MEARLSHQAVDHTRHLVSLRLRLRTSDHYRALSQVVHELAPRHAFDRIEAVHKVEHNAYNSACSSVTSPAVQVNNLSFGNVLDQVSRQLQDALIVGDAAVSNGKVDKRQTCFIDAARG